MNPKDIYLKLLSQKKDPRLALFVISSHVDKPVLETFDVSDYEIPIQAGAAKTQERICDLNDYDGFSESISERNHRYSEFTAIYWMWKHVDAPWIGISHYRRKYVISDTEIKKCLDSGTDMITLKTISRNPNVSVEEQFVLDHYGDEWKLAIDLLKKQYPQYAEVAGEVFSKPDFHPYAMSIMRRELFDEFCEMLYSILFQLEPLCCEKKDVYQRRDMGFIGERFLSMFVEYQRRMGRLIQEVDVKVLKTDEWIPWNACDLSDENSVMKELERLFSLHDIEKCIVLLSYIKCDSKALKELIFIFNLYMEERKYLQATFLEYLSDNITDDVHKLLMCFERFNNHLLNLHGLYSQENEAQFVCFLKQNPFTHYIIYYMCAKNQLVTVEFMNALVLTFAEYNITEPILPILEKLHEIDSDNEMTLLNTAYIFVQYGAYSDAEKYLDKIQNQNNEIVLELRSIIRGK